MLEAGQSRPEPFLPVVGDNHRHSLVEEDSLAEDSLPVGDSPVVDSLVADTAVTF